MKHAAEAEPGGRASGWLGRNIGSAFSEDFMWRGEGIGSSVTFFKSLA